MDTPSWEQLLQMAEGTSGDVSEPSPPPGVGAVEPPAATPGGSVPLQAVSTEPTATPSWDELLKMAEEPKAPTPAPAPAVRETIPGAPAPDFPPGPDKMTAPESNVENMGAAAWDATARALAWPPSVLGHVLASVGATVVNDKGQLATPDDVVERVKQGMRAAGINPDPDMDRLSGKIGHETMNGLMTALAITSAAPSIASRAAALGKPWVEAVATALAKNPVLGISQEFGASPGAVLARESQDKEHPVRQTIAGLSGAMLGGGLFGIMGQLAHKAANLANSVAGKVIPQVVPESIQQGVNKTAAALPGAAEVPPAVSTVQPTTPLRPTSASPEAAVEFSKHQVESDRIVIQQAIDDAINSVPRAQQRNAGGARAGEVKTDPRTGEPVQTYTGPESQAVLRERLEAASKVGRAMEERAWDAVGQNTKIRGFDMQQDMARFVNSADYQAAQLNFRPDKEIEAFNALWAPKGNSTAASVPTIREMRSWFTQVRRRIDAEASKANPNQDLITNLQRAEQIAMHGLEKSFNC